MAPRGRGGKFSKPTRGGGKKFSRDLQPLDREGNQMGMWRDPQEQDGSSEEEEEESSEEESSSEDGGEGTSSVTATAAAAAGGGGELTREQRREAARLKKQAAIARKNKKTAEVGDLPSSSESDEEEEDDDMPANPNHTQKARSMARAATGPSGEATAPPSTKSADKENLSRREREAIAAQQAKERYQKLHAEGKTDEAKADLARLRLIREQREAAAARKQAEKEERDAREKERDDREAKRREAALGGGAPAKKGAKGGKK